MAGFILPKSAYSAVQALVALEDQQFDELVKGLEGAAPGLDSDAFVDDAIAGIRTFDSEVARIIVNELLTMVFTGSRNNLSLLELAKDLSEAALDAASEKFPFTVEQKKILESRLLKALGINSVRITGKAQDVFLDTDKRYLAGRVLTDLRPVFNEVGEEILAGTVMHSLRIRYSENGQTKDVYFSMRKEDLTTLMQTVERALAKEVLLSELVRKSSIQELQ
ncbi:MAG: hypothetical protein C5B58_15340 [Acidobacteria bacterium]|nr:MAG: hypothetical protein C5B58_15340 [Acidobacteriota bacterium]